MNILQEIFSEWDTSVFTEYQYDVISIIMD